MTHPVEVHYREISAASDALWVGLPLGALLLCLLVAAGSLVPSSIGGPATPSPEAIAVGLSAALAALPLAALVGWSCGRAIRRSRYIGAEVAAAALGLVALVVLPAVGLAFGCAAWGLAPALPLAGLCAMVGAWLAERGIERVLEVVEEAEACSHAAREASQGLTPARPVPWGGQWRFHLKPGALGEIEVLASGLPRGVSRPGRARAGLQGAVPRGERLAGAAAAPGGPATGCGGGRRQCDVAHKEGSCIYLRNV